MISALTLYINGLVQERCNSSALAMELRLSSINPLICGLTTQILVLPKMINMNVLKILYWNTTHVPIFQYSYLYVQYYSPQPWPEAGI